MRTPSDPAAAAAHLTKRLLAIRDAHARGEMDDALYEHERAKLTEELRAVTAKANAPVRKP